MFFHFTRTGNTMFVASEKGCASFVENHESLVDIDTNLKHWIDYFQKEQSVFFVLCEP